MEIRWGDSHGREYIQVFPQCISSVVFEAIPYNMKTIPQWIQDNYGMIFKTMQLFCPMTDILKAVFSKREIFQILLLLKHTHRTSFYT